ncbi:MAG: glycosyltransferase family 4 protein, partial [Sulfuricurvum sp.]|nr:glycosyltransferase family 4 protein [Sulfuricurvum sp.]
GITAHVYEFSKALKALGHKVSIVTKTTENATKPFEVVDDINVYRIKLKFIGITYGFQINRFIKKNLVHINPDLIHIHGMRPLEFYDIKNIPLVYTNHTSGYLKRLKKGGYRIPLMKKLFSKPDLFLAPSEELLKTPFAIRAPKVYIPNGIDFYKFDPNAIAKKELRFTLGIKEDHQVAIITRRLVQKNGVKYLGEAMEFIKNKHLFMVVIGDGEEKEIIYNLLQKWIPERFVMLGSMRHDQIVMYYNVADFSVLPSLMEATSISGLEAMASGLPLVGTRVGGIPDLIDDGINGFLCDPASPQSLAFAIDKLLNSDIKGMGDMSRQKAKQFDWSVIAQKTIDAYRRVV